MKTRTFSDPHGAQVSALITICADGPMTNIASAITIAPEFASLAKELIFMGGSLNPITDDPEFVNTPRHEFNLWLDPEAAHICADSTLEEGCLHDRRHFSKDSPDTGTDRSSEGAWRLWRGEMEAWT